jgi:hypothetical protein
VGKQLLIRKGTRQQETDATGDHGPDFQELKTDRADIGIGQLGAIERQPADGLEQCIGQA